MVTPEQGLISSSLPLEPLRSGLQAAEVILDQLQVQKQKLQLRHFQEMEQKEGLSFEVDKLISTLLRGGRWRMAQVDAQNDFKWVGAMRCR